MNITFNKNSILMFCQELIGNVAGKLHTGRSRNDQVIFIHSLSFKTISVFSKYFKTKYTCMCNYWIIYLMLENIIFVILILGCH